MLPKVGSGVDSWEGVLVLTTQKPINRWKGNFAFFWMPATPGGQRGHGGRADLCLKADWQSQSVGKCFYRQRERATCVNSTVSSDSHLPIGHQGPDQHHLGCFRYSESSVPGSVCFHVFEASSLNYGSLWHGYSLVCKEIQPVLPKGNQS